MAGAMYASMRLPHILLIFLLLLAIWRYKMFSATEMAVKLTLRLYFFLWDLLFLLFLFVHWDLLNVVAMYQREFFFFLINSNSLIAKITDVQAHCHYYFLIYQFLFCFFAFLRSDKDHVFKFFRLQVSKICVNSFNLFAYIFFNIVTFFFFFLSCNWSINDWIFEIFPATQNKACFLNYFNSLTIWTICHTLWQ